MVARLKPFSAKTRSDARTIRSRTSCSCAGVMRGIELPKRTNTRRPTPSAGRRDVLRGDYATSVALTTRMVVLYGGARHRQTTAFAARQEDPDVQPLGSVR